MHVAHLADEGAANHVRLCADHGEPGVNLLVWGREAFEPWADAFPARQTREASQAVASRHGASGVVLARQSRAAIAGGRPVALVWLKRVWRCEETACGQRTWSEPSAAIRARSVLTERARAGCARRVGQDPTDVARVAADLGVGWGTVMRAV